MATGAFYIDRSALDEFARRLTQVAGHSRDLSRLYRKIGKHAEAYVIANEPVYAGSSKDSSTHKPPGYMQSQTKGGGGKRGAYVRISGVEYLSLQEFGGTSYWYRGGGMRGLIRQFDTEGGRSYKHKHRKLLPRDLSSIAARYGLGGHTVYKVPRNPKGRFVWNVAYRIRGYIGITLCGGLQEISIKRGIEMEIGDTNLDIRESYLTGRS